MFGRDTVNTLPPATLQTFLDHGHVAPTLEANVEEARVQLTRLSDLGIDLCVIAQKLQGDGVDAFAKSFEALSACIANKREQLQHNL